LLLDLARKDILERISLKTGYTISESTLSPKLRQAITTLALVERSMYTMRQIYNAELNRSNQNFITKVISRKDKPEIEKDGNEVQRLKVAIDLKVEDLSKRIIAEQTLKQMPNDSESNSAPLTALKCPNCGASLQLPTNMIVKCEYCGSSLSIQNLQLQLSSIVQGV
jgi:hypothetical protein